MIVDILVGIILVVSALIAFLRGFIREVLTIAGVVGGMAAAYYFSPHLQPFMRGWLGVDEAAEEPQKLFGIIPLSMAADALSYGAIFITVVIVLSIVSHLLAETIKSIGLGAIDRTLGIIFGLVRGILLLALLYMPVHLFVDDETKAEWFAGSQSHFYLAASSTWLAGFLPEETLKNLEEQAGERSEQMKEGARETLQKMDLLNKMAKPGEAPVENPAPVAPEDGTPAAENPSPEPEPEPAPQDGKGTGYDNQFRDQMDQLFEKKVEPEKTP
jgi:membrane protein required for colicin V production